MKKLPLEALLILTEIKKAGKKLSKNIEENYKELETTNPSPFAIEPKEKMPLYITTQNLSLNLPNFKIPLNLMFLIEHNIKNNTITLIGRIREENLLKIIAFQSKNELPLTTESLLGMKIEAGMIINQMTSLPYLQKEGEQEELSFDENEPLESILDKLNSSGLFNLLT